MGLFLTGGRDCRFAIEFPAGTIPGELGGIGARPGLSPFEKTAPDGFIMPDPLQPCIAPRRGCCTSTRLFPDPERREPHHQFPGQSASARVTSTASPPHLVLMMIAPFFICAIASASPISRVAWVKKRSTPKAPYCLRQDDFRPIVCCRSGWKSRPDGGRLKDKCKHVLGHGAAVAPGVLVSQMPQRLAAGMTRFPYPHSVTTNGSPSRTPASRGVRRYLRVRHVAWTDAMR